ncbi:hypothetical protein RHSIM_Rhsim09G0190300 [Rhododendron simsii]|uniref:Methyltransferase type 11 domain-containing protein n=1 Tax=Rhododendron simsii TaxID=118357 RepID=A0A834LEY2_RHOSS|nr:hypothetical protein RHSIM_Rhsim09G0190300 [Rhododendron simsii]
MSERGHGFSGYNKMSSKSIESPEVLICSCTSESSTAARRPHCKIIKTPPQAQTELNRPKHVWTAEIGAQHHLFKDKDDALSLLSDHRSAQIRMIEETLRFAAVPEDPVKTPKNVVDVGCGIGGSSRYIARKYEAQCQGITLSPVQAQRANALAAAQGLADKVSFQVADALNQPFPDAQFDLVWSMESGEHMPHKAKFVNELARVAAPGGTIIIVTWCHRDLSPSEESLRPEEKALLQKICDAYHLPAWCSAADYVKILESLSLQDIKTADWSENVAPFWPAVIRSALTWKGITSLLRSGWKTIRGALVMPLMIRGYKMGLIKFAIITCRKPEHVVTTTTSECAAENI